MEEYIKFKEKLIKSIQVKYNDIDYGVINSEINIFNLIKYITNDDNYLRKLFLYLSKNFMLDMKEWNDRNIGFTEDKKMYLDKYKEGIREVVEDFVSKIEYVGLDLENVNLVENIKSNFKYINKYKESIKSIVDNDGIVMVDNDNPLFTDILIATYILNNEEITLVTDNLKKQENIYNWLANKKINFISSKINISELEQEFNECSQKLNSIRLYNDKGIIDEYIKSKLNASLLKIHKLVDFDLKLEDVSKFRNELNLYNKFDDISLEDLIKQKENEKDEYKRKEILEKIREVKETKIDIIKNFDRKKVDENLNKLIEIIDFEILNLKNDDLEEEYNLLQTKLHENVFNKISKNYFINIKNRIVKEISIINLQGVVIIDKIERLSKNVIENIISNSSKIILLGTFEKSEIKDIYDRTKFNNKFSIKEIRDESLC